MDHVVVQRWLRQVLAPYDDPQRTYADLDAALIALSSLSPRTEVYTYNDGRSRLLVTLAGTIPIQYRANTYNIPVAFWIPKAYPREPPIAYVVPTSDMLVRKGPNVDPSGEILGSYLDGWKTKPEACNLLDLIRHCQHMFGQEPPVCAKPKSAATPQPGAAADLSSSRSPSSTTPVDGHASASYASPHPTHDRFDRQLPPLAISAQPHLGPVQSAIDARNRPPPPPPAPGQRQPGAGAAMGSPAGPAPDTPPLRLPKPSQSPDAYLSHDPRWVGQEPPHHAARHPNGNQNSLPYGHSPLAGPQRSASNDVPASGASLNARQFAPHRAATMHVTSASMSSLSSPDRYGERAPDRQSLDGRPHPQHYAHQQPHRYDGVDPNIASHVPAPHSPLPARGAPQQAAHADQAGPDRQAPVPSSYHPGWQPHRAGQQPLPSSHSHQLPPLTLQTGSSASQPPAPPALAPSQASSQALPPPTQPKPQQENLMDALDGDDEDNPGAAAGRHDVGGASGSTAAGPPPPRPPNPELLAMHERLLDKIQSRLASLSASLEQSNQHLQVLSSDLDRGRPAIEDEMRRLEAVRDVCRATGDRMEATVEEAKERIEWLRNKEEPDVDGMVLATSIVGNQLVDLVAEDNAIEDALYQLSRALNAERIDLDRFLKQTRMLAREQFMKRALAFKIVEGMGWQS
ncbi:Suppressor protein stp22 of temperature-sensitive alpha-factor receptor and arginine permease [Thecaphora frezii]